ncbi:hypothetical protein RC74_10475 [Falsihalocynthiibacter arcticus]|uniref:Uncharacterized protein n=1 Tax=Falsihalocynthiibacter arcticus TaxID=1579316 RepID=A0A126UZY3_9RHOB|nr:hypothetical protein RC74_10475 [Falsihalocynthiibacter arcticus]
MKQARLDRIDLTLQSRTAGLDALAVIVPLLDSGPMSTSILSLSCLFFIKFVAAVFVNSAEDHLILRQ